MTMPSEVVTNPWLQPRMPVSTNTLLVSCCMACILPVPLKMDSGVRQNDGSLSGKLCGSERGRSNENNAQGGNRGCDVRGRDRRTRRNHGECEGHAARRNRR